MKKSSDKTDIQIEEFDRKDLGKDFVQSGTAVVVRPKYRQKPTSIVLAPSMIAKLKAKAQKRGIGYQTMLKIIIHEHVDEY